MKGIYKVCCYNKKGGIGKTTISINLATSLSTLGYRVLLLDLDSQADATSFFNLEEEIQKKSSLYNVLFNKGTLENTIYKINDNLSILSNTNFEDINNLLYNRGSSFFTKTFTELENKFDFCIIDCAPTENSVNAHICFFSSEILLISQPEYLATKAIMGVYTHMKSRLKKDKIHSIIINKFKRTNEHKQIIELIEDVFKDKSIYIIKDKISIANSIRTQKNFYSLGDKELEEEFNKLLKELIDRWMRH